MLLHLRAAAIGAAHRSRRRGRRAEHRPAASVVLMCLASAWLFAPAATAQPTLRLTPVGPTDALHTEAKTGRREGWFPSISAEGLVIGATQQCGASNGWTVWAFDPSTEKTTLLGLRDAEHTMSNGGSSSTVYGEYTSRTPGVVYGHSQRYMNDAPLGQSAWRYKAGDAEARRIGLFDVEHTSTATQEQISTVTGHNSRGDAIGWSRRYVNGVWAGQSAWFLSAQSNETVRIGLIDGLHVSPVGISSRHSEARLIAECGVVAGISTLYHSATLPPGRSAWVFDPDHGTTTQVGMFDAEHIDPSGYHNSAVGAITPDGTVIGTTERFINGRNRGTTLWRLPRGAPHAIPLGLADAEHTSASGTRASTLVRVSDAFIVGNSTRWQGEWTPRGLTPWLYNRDTGLITPLGLTDDEHTSSAGVRISHISHVLDDGHVLGATNRYVENEIAGATPWLWNPLDGTYVRLGLHDATHTRSSNGYRYSRALYTLPTGFVIGSSLRWTPDERTTAWAYEIATGNTTILGIADEEHTVDSSGLPDSRPTLSGDGRAIDIFAAGRTRRAAGGETPWFHDPRRDAPIPVGPWDSRHTSSTGEREIGVSSGDLIGERTVGSARRYIGAQSGGRTPFVFDVAKGRITRLVFSERADGYAWASITNFDENGTLVGAFLNHDADDGSRFRAYMWSPDTGMRALDDAIQGGFESAGYRLSQFEDAAVQIRTLGQGLWTGIAFSVHHPGQATFVLAPLPPCTADFDHDGEIASPDFFAFLTAWFILDPRTDIDADGAITSADLFAFLTAWFAGCD